MERYMHICMYLSTLSEDVVQSRILTRSGAVGCASVHLLDLVENRRNDTKAK